MNSPMTQVQLPPSKIRSELVRCLKAKLVPIVTSSPGMGKSSIIVDIAQEFRLEVMDFRLSQCDVTDLNGLPRFIDGRAQFAPFDIFPLEGDTVPAGKEGWLFFLDEINAAPKQLQAAAYKLILERKVGNRKLHERVAIVCAGNLSTDNAVVHEMSTALQSRLVHYEMRTDFKEWSNWAIEAGIDSRVIAFLEFRPNLLNNFSPDHQDKTFACQRTWEMVSKGIKDQKSVGFDDLSFLSGTIGSGPANEFITFSKIWQDLPTIAEIEKDPGGCRIPEEPGTKYAIAVYLSEHTDEKNATPVAKFLTRLPAECRVLWLRMINKRNPRLRTLPPIVELGTALMQRL